MTVHQKTNKRDVKKSTPESTVTIIATDPTELPNPEPGILKPKKKKKKVTKKVPKKKVTKKVVTKKKKKKSKKRTG